MSDRSKAVLAAFLALPRDEQEQVAEQVLGLLDSDAAPEDEAGVQAAWVQLARERDAAYHRGETKAIPFDEIRQMLRTGNTK